MLEKIKDVCILTKTLLSHDQIDEIASQVQKIKGVLQFTQLTEKPRLIVVVYNVSQTKAVSILNKITRLGFNASIISNCGEQP